MNTQLYTLLPRRLLSAGMYRLSRITHPMLKKPIISTYMRITGADTSFAAEKNPHAYPSLNAFFTRALADGARPIDPDPQHIVSPVDGRCAIHEQLKTDTMLQAKGMPYTASQLLGSAEWSAPFHNGTTATLYLAPDDYHRIHMPCDGTLTAMRFCPGDKHSVALPLLNKIPNIFAGNERVVCLFDTEFGRMALVMVGALNVSSISTVWHGDVHNAANNTYHYPKAHTYRKGEEIGRFNLGSTVILIFQPNRINWVTTTLNRDSKLHMGETIASAAQS